jgi:hypothetical protein
MRGKRRKSKGELFLAAELGDVHAMVYAGGLFHKHDLQRFIWRGRAAASGEPVYFLNEMSDEIRNFNRGAGYANVVFVRTSSKGHHHNEKRTILGDDYKFDAFIGPANQALRFYEFELQSYRKAVDSWTIVGLRKNVVKDIRKMIGKMIWDARKEAAYFEEK